ncbi:hypothetical protein [Nocardia farcinica]|nr:hypothetical protein [Nocardia farcinica]MBF6575014.1 hypothetical protein [Nocardia farcinica]
MRQLEQMVMGHVGHYDLILRTALDSAIPLDHGKPRGTDLTFRALADQHVAKVHQRLGIEHVLLPADGHDRALLETVAFIRARLEGIENAGAEGPR